jgi:hypothetical protein
MVHPRIRGEENRTRAKFFIVIEPLTNPRLLVRHLKKTIQANIYMLPIQMQSGIILTAYNDSCVLRWRAKQDLQYLISSLEGFRMLD